MRWDERLDELADGGGPDMVFQPVVRLSTQATVGYEALARFPGYGFTPDVWFRSAALLGRTLELELCAARNALACCDDLPDGCYLSINASPSLLVGEDFGRVVAASGCDPARLMVEVTEREAVADYEALRKALGRLRTDGAEISVSRIGLAIDDVGAGFASMRHLVELRPDLIKLDISLVRDVDTDDARRSMCHALTAFAHNMAMRVAAEGVETPEEMAMLELLGVDYGQGYLFARPGPLP